MTEFQRESPGALIDADMTLISQWDGYPQHVCEIIKRKTKKPVVYFAFDFHQNKPAWHWEMARECDLFLSPEIHHRDEYLKQGVNFHWMPQAFSPEFLDRSEIGVWDGDKAKIIKEYDVLFTGSYVDYGTFRIELLKEIDKKFNLHVCSVTQQQWIDAGLKDVNPPEVDNALPELIAKAKINISVDLNQRYGTWSDRNAQIMCCGGFVLFKYTPYSEVVFKDKIAYFNSIEDCLNKIDYYLEHEEERNKIANDGYEYAQSNLKAKSKAKELLIVLENRPGEKEDWDA